MNNEIDFCIGCDNAEEIDETGHCEQCAEMNLRFACVENGVDLDLLVQQTKGM